MEMSKISVRFISSAHSTALVGVLALFTGCSSLPTIVPDMAVSHSQVRLEDAHGPLSEQQSKVILASLKSSKEPTALLDRHLALEGAVAGTPLVVGNRVVLLEDG